MSKEALIFVGLAAAIGIGLAVKSADAEPAASGGSPPPSPDPLPAGSDNQGPGEVPDLPAGVGPGESGSGGPTLEDIGLGGPFLDKLPIELAHIDLSGIERIHYAGIQRVSSEQVPFYTWVVNDSINGMDMYIYVSKDNPTEWISMFRHEDGAGSVPPFHMITYKISDTPNHNWMVENIAGMDVTPEDLVFIRSLP